MTNCAAVDAVAMPASDSEIMSVSSAPAYPPATQQIVDKVMFLMKEKCLFTE